MNGIGNAIEGFGSDFGNSIANVAGGLQRGPDGGTGIAEGALTLNPSRRKS